jgi:hypothetical protein
MALAATTEGARLKLQALRSKASSPSPSPARRLPRPGLQRARRRSRTALSSSSQILQHHDPPQTGWHTENKYCVTLPVAAAATEAALPVQPITTCMHQVAEDGTEAKVPNLAEHLPIHGLRPIDRTPKGNEGAPAAHFSGASSLIEVEVTKVGVPWSANWGRALLAMKAIVRLSCPNHPDHPKDSTATTEHGRQSNLRHAGGAT